LVSLEEDGGVAFVETEVGSGVGVVVLGCSIFQFSLNECVK